jgi:hypothetical protein
VENLARDRTCQNFAVEFLKDFFIKIDLQTCLFSVSFLVPRALSVTEHKVNTNSFSMNPLASSTNLKKSKCILDRNFV